MGEEGGKKEHENMRSKHIHDRRKCFFSVALKNLFFRGSPPPRLWGLAYGVSYRRARGNTAVKGLAPSRSAVLYASWPAAA